MFKQSYVDALTKALKASTNELAEGGLAVLGQIQAFDKTRLTGARKAVGLEEFRELTGELRKTLIGLTFAAASDDLEQAQSPVLAAERGVTLLPGNIQAHQRMGTLHTLLRPQTTQWERLTEGLGKEIGEINAAYRLVAESHAR